MKPAKKKQLESLFFDVQRRCEGLDWGQWRELLSVIEEQERVHRRMGARFTDGKAKYAGNVAVAVKYFACKAILEPLPLPETWAAFNTWRRDYQIGQGLRERAGDLSHLELIWSDLAIDYAEDIAS